MTTYAKMTAKTELPEERCDSRIWSGECSEATTSGNEYLCSACGTIPKLDHEVHHEIFPHVSGDTHNLS